MKAALIQLRVSEHETAAERWARVERTLSQLEDNRIDLVMLPELWGVGFSRHDEYAEQAEPCRGTTLLRLAPWARRLNCHILTGSFVERDGDRLYNTTALLDNRGQLLETYRKIHLFGYHSREREVLTPGVHTSAVYTQFGIFGMATCYDLRFPEQFRRMTERGATVFLVAAAWPHKRLEEWRLFCRVRALENQSFLLACNHVGTHGGATGAGHSMVVAPDGTILAEAGDKEGVLTASFDLNEVQRFRDAFPALRDQVPFDM